MVRSYDIETGALRWESEYLEHRAGMSLWHGSDVDIVGGRVFAGGYEAGRSRTMARPRLRPGVRLTVAVDGGRVFVAGSGARIAGDSDLILSAYDAQ
jgi:hypothetical protein